MADDVNKKNTREENRKNKKSVQSDKSTSTNDKSPAQTNRADIAQQTAEAKATATNMAKPPAPAGKDQSNNKAIPPSEINRVDNSTEDNALLREDYDFVSETKTAILEQTPKGGRVILWVTFLALVTAIVWAHFAKVDEIARGNGKVIPSKRIQEVQNLEGGIISEILVRDGQVVDKGQILFRIDDVRFSSSFRGSQVTYAALKAKAARLQAEANNSDFTVPAELAQESPELVDQERILFDTRAAGLAAKRAVLDQQVRQRQQELAEAKAKQRQLRSSFNLVRRELNLTRPLVSQGAVSAVEVLRLERQVNDFRGQLDAVTLSIPRIESTITEAETSAKEVDLRFRNDARKELNEVNAELASLSESNLALEDRVNRTLVRSPVRGRIKELVEDTVGGVVQPGEVMAEIVPLDDKLVVETNISPRDVAYLHPGQQAIVKFTAYDFAVHGGLEGKVVNISADTFKDEQGVSYFKVLVQTDKNHLGSGAEDKPIIPGMQASVDIITGKKSILSYLLKPILRAQQKALTER